MARRLAAAALLAALALAVAAPASAQALRPFLYINQERILTGSERGRALLAEEEQARDDLRAEARGIESDFEAEERQLTEQRPTLSAEAFRAKSNDFDARVVKARADQDARAATLAQEFDQRRRAFYAAVAPILVGVMERAGALAIFDENTVLIADQSLNVTDEVIAAIDATQPDAPAPEVPPVGGAAAPGHETGGGAAPDAGPGAAVPEAAAPGPEAPAPAPAPSIGAAPAPAARIPAEPAATPGPRARPQSE